MHGLESMDSDLYRWLSLCNGSSLNHELRTAEIVKKSSLEQFYCLGMVRKLLPEWKLWQWGCQVTFVDDITSDASYVWHQHWRWHNSVRPLMSFVKWECRLVNFGPITHTWRYVYTTVSPEILLTKCSIVTFLNGIGHWPTDLSVNYYVTNKFKTC